MSVQQAHVLVDPVSLYQRLGPERYGHLISTYKWSGPKDMERILEDTPMKDATVVDLGIGNGALSPFFRKAAVGKIIGVDGARDFLTFCLQSGRADQVEYADFQNAITDLPDSCADVVTASGLLSYLENPQPLIWEIERIAKPGATVAVNFHAASYSIEHDYVPASTLHPQGVTKINHHAPDNIRWLFDDVDVRLEAQMHNPRGIKRSGERFVPLTTQRYRVL